MKNYYEILEVDKNASYEIIEKAYKTLAKKYHPDLQNSDKSQNKMQQINEAYEILSNDFKRREYDEKLQEQNVSIEEYNKIIQENNKLRRDLQRITASNNEINSNQIDGLQFVRRYYRQMKKVSGQQIQYNQNKKKISIEKIKGLIIYVLVIIAIILVLAVVPISRNFFVNLYNTNTVIKMIVDIIIDTFSRGF